MSKIHSTAVIEDGAVLGADAEIGPYCVIGNRVRIGDGARLESHVVIAGRTTIGTRAHIFPFASIGHQPQDLKYKGEDSELIVGDNVTIREYVTINPGTEGGGMVTRIGDNCLLMTTAHVGHDCHIGDYVILVTNATLGGHVEIGDYGIVGGLAAVHQFVRIGRHAMIGGMSGVENDVIPYGSVIGNRARLSGLNIVGLRRRGFGRDDIHTLRAAYRLLFAQEGTLQERMADVAEMFPDNEAVMEIVEFMRASGSRAICQPGHGDADI